ncbi:hypothetical protein B0O99DRAFT_686918 [Bisporella sp. PMI_857]|nr:hypothetical protein B0O99DRAFT_686918 [Bisporella sp. PMI_857]
MTTSPPSHLLYVNLQPAEGVEQKTWIKNIVQGYIPELIKSKAATRVSLYSEDYNFPLAAKQKHARSYLLYIQTTHPELLKTDVHALIATEKQLIPTFKSTSTAEELDVRNYDLIRSYDPKNYKNVAAPSLLTVELQPADEEDLLRWYEDEHFAMLAALDGYCRSARYTIGAKTDYTLGEMDQLPKYIAVHDFDKLDVFSTPEGDAVSNTPWTVKVLNTSSIFIVRGWDLIDCQGV